MKLAVTDEAVRLIKSFEGFVSSPYKDAVGVCTIGYGTTYYPGGDKVECSDRPITEEEASRILKGVLKKDFYHCVLSLINVEETTQHEFNSLLSFVYNVGCNALKKSTLLKKHNRGDKIGASEEFSRWVYARGKRLKGLVSRREKEKQMYLHKKCSKDD